MSDNSGQRLESYFRSNTNGCTYNAKGEDPRRRVHMKKQILWDEVPRDAGCQDSSEDPVVIFTRRTGGIGASLTAAINENFHDYLEHWRNGLLYSLLRL